RRPWRDGSGRCPCGAHPLQVIPPLSYGLSPTQPTGGERRGRESFFAQCLSAISRKYLGEKRLPTPCPALSPCHPFTLSPCHPFIRPARTPARRSRPRRRS